MRYRHVLHVLVFITLYSHRFTVKAFIVQDCYTTSGEKKTLEHIAEVLRFIVKPKPEVKGDELNISTENSDINEADKNTKDPNDASINDEILLAAAAEILEEEEGQETSDKDCVMSEEDNTDDADYKPTGKSRREVRGAKKRKLGFKLRIRQPAAEKANAEKDSTSDKSKKDTEEKAKPKRKRKAKTEKRVPSGSSKGRRQTEEVIQIAKNVHCFICEDEDIRYVTEDDLFEHIVMEHVDHSSETKMVLPCSKCDKSFRVPGVKGAKSFMRTPMYTLLNHLVDKHGIVRPEWAPVYKYVSELSKNVVVGPLHSLKLFMICILCYFRKFARNGTCQIRHVQKFSIGEILTKVDAVF